MEAALFRLDAEKAFDSLRWSFLFGVLAKFGFHKDFTGIIKTLYDKTYVQIKINGGLSDPFKLDPDTRQECPISPHLFALFIEPLSQWITQNHSIKGMDMGSGEHKLALFANDIIDIYICDNLQSHFLLTSLRGMRPYLSTNLTSQKPKY